MGETLEEYVFQLQKGTPNGEGGNWSAKEITDDIKSIISDNKIELNGILDTFFAGSDRI